MPEEPEPRPAITKVWARNFRSIEYAELELDPLTVLVGPNASGKSNLLDIIGFLSDAVRDGLETAINRRGGIDSITHRRSTDEGILLEFGLIQRAESRILECNFGLSPQDNGDYRIERESVKVSGFDSSRGPTEVELINRLLTKPSPDEFLRLRGTWANENQLSLEHLRHFLSDSGPGIDQRNFALISESTSRVITLLDVLTSGEAEPLRSPYFSLKHSVSRLNDAISGFRSYHIFPNSLRNPQKVADSHPLSDDGDNLASTLRDMIQKKNRFLPDLKHALNYAVPGITDIRVSRAGSFQVVELKHGNGRNGRGTWFDLSYESDGTIRLLAMLTALFQEPSLPLIGLEEPELAIHPGAMAVLAENMVEASLRGQVVVATHSPDLITLMPVESIRAVSAESGSTKVGRIAAHQLKSVHQGLFSAGEIHSMMGLCPEEAGD